MVAKTAKKTTKKKISGSFAAPVKAAKKKSASSPVPPQQRALLDTAARVQKRLDTAPESVRKMFEERLEMSWIYHDSALEGAVYTETELQMALDGETPEATPTSETGAQPAAESIRRHREAIRYVLEQAKKPEVPITLDTIREIAFILHPEDGGVQSLRYRKDIPQHRLYFHEYAPPEKIAAKLEQVVEWINDPKVRAGNSVLRLAARAHYDLLRVFPFSQDSGKVARLLLNLLLLRHNYPRAIIHMSERQRYYESLKTNHSSMTQIVFEAIENNLKSIEQLLDHLLPDAETASQPEEP